MSTIHLNVLQERELKRLLDYEQSTCSANGELVYRCAFPFRPDDELQCELIACGALTKRTDERRGSIVTITSDGQSYFLAKEQAEYEKERTRRHESRLIGFSAGFAVVCVVIGFILGRVVA